MKITALKEKSGVYEIRQSNKTIFGGIVIDGKNRGVGFAENTENNRCIFEFEDGMFSKSITIFLNSKENQIGTVKLGFTDSGTLETASGNYEWKAIGSSKIWVDTEQNTVMFFDLENNPEKFSSVLYKENLESNTRGY